MARSERTTQFFLTKNTYYILHESISSALFAYFLANLYAFCLPHMDMDFYTGPCVVSLAGHRVLVDSSQGAPSMDFHYPEEEDDVKNMPTVHELLLVGMGHRKLRPVLFARVGEDVVIYEAFSFSDDLDAIQLKIRFKKIDLHQMILRLPKGTNTAANQIGLVDRKNYFTPFSNVSVYNGVSDQSSSMTLLVTNLCLCSQN